MHQDINTLQPPNTREKYDTPLLKKPEVLQKIAHDGQWIAQVARLRYPLAGALLLHYFQGSGSARQINISRDSSVGNWIKESNAIVDSGSVSDTYLALRMQNIKVAKQFFQKNPDQEIISIRSPWMPKYSQDMWRALGMFYISTVSTITAVKDPSGKIIGLRERSTGVVSDFYDFSAAPEGMSIKTPLGDISRADLHATGHPDARAAKGFQVYGFDTLINGKSIIPWTP